MKFRAIPQLPQRIDAQTRAVLAALKENLEILAGQRGATVERLSETASLPEVVAKVNELIDRLA